MKTLYMVVEGLTELSMETKINEYLEQGWICQGGVAVTVSSGFGYKRFYQAMIKKTNELEENVG
jgi:hypothetical protein